MPTLEMIVLQPTPFCNISCKYCYLPDRSSTAKMTFETLHKVFSGLFSSGWLGDKLAVLWHAGEPMVLPTDYYAEAFRIIGSLAPGSTKVEQCFQTNGMLIDDDWCKFFKANDVRVGVSIDGPEEINNVNRVTRSGRATFSQTLSGIRCLQRNDIEFSVISVLSSASLGRPQELFDFYRSEGIKNVCFNIEEIEGVNITSSLHGRDQEIKFENFMREFWNLTVNSTALYYVREFQQMLHNIITPDERRIHNSLVQPFAMLNVDCEGNFSTFSPEFLGQKNGRYNDFIIGNFWETDLKDSLDSDVFKRLNNDVAAGVELCRTSCEYFPVCGGGSPVNKLYENGTPVSSETMYCRLNVKVMANLAMEIIETSAAEEQEKSVSHEAARADLYLLGAGVSFPEHLTTQTVEILEACSRICTNLPENRLSALPEDLRAKCISLTHLYQDNRRRTENYRDVARAVINTAEGERPVAWLTPGHPRVFDSVSEALLEAGRSRGWKVSVVPAVSCLDTLLAELDYDAAGGLLVHDATSLVAQNVALVPSVATLLLQPDVFGSDRAHLSPEFTGADLTRLRDHLLQFYAPEHRCAFIRSATEPGQRHRISWVQLRDLASVPDRAVPGSTLFLSAAEWEYAAKPRAAATTRPGVRRKGKQPGHDGKLARKPGKPRERRIGRQRDGEISGRSEVESDAVRQSRGGEVVGWGREGSSRIVVFLGGVSDNLDRVEVSATTTRPPVSIGKWFYNDGAIVPDQTWRALTADERRFVIAGSPPNHFGKGVSIVRLPPALLQPFQALRKAAAEVRREEELLLLLGSAICSEGTRSVVEHVRRQFQRAPATRDAKEEMIEGGILVKPPGLLTVTVQPGSNTLIGLHLDDWYSFPLERRHLAPNRICLNLGCEDRFFLFVNLPIAQMREVVKRSGMSAESGGTRIARTFMSLCPSYPVVRVRIRPGEAYIAPTENVMHDASSIGMSMMDLTLSIRGRFEMSAV